MCVCLLKRNALQLIKKTVSVNISVLGEPLHTARQTTRSKHMVDVRAEDDVQGGPAAEHAGLQAVRVEGVPRHPAAPGAGGA